MPNLIEIRYMF